MSADKLGDPEQLPYLAAKFTADHLMVLDLEGVIRYINHTAPGLTVEDVVGVKAVHFVPEEYRPILENAYDRTRRTGLPTRYETAFIDHEGVSHVYEARVAAILIEGEHVGYAISSSDITERIQERIDLERFFNLSDDLMCVLDTDGIFRRVNPKFRSLGFVDEDLLGRSQLEFIDPDDRDRVGDAFARLDAGSPIHVEFRGRAKDGTLRDLLVTMVRSEAQDSVYGMGRDITEQKSLQEQLLRSQKMEAVGQLAGGVAHDYNNLLMSVIINTQTALELLDSDDPAARYLLDVQKAANLSADLTKQLLAFSRRRALRAQHVDLNDLTGRLLEMLRRTIPENVVIDFEPSRESAGVLADPSQVEQVLLNLSLNARDAMPSGGRLTLTTELVEVDRAFVRAHPTAKQGRYVRLCVHDTGVGMPPEVIEHIYEPFYTTKGAGRGTGLGLTIVFDVVERHEGLIHVKSQPGHGTAFTVYFPAADPVRKPVEVATRSASLDGSETILVAEDEGFVRRVVAEVLSRAGYEVLLAENGAEALELLEGDGMVDLLLLDVVMPVMGGPDVLRALREQGRSIKTILVSGYGDRALANEPLEDIPLLRKPYAPEDLLTLLRRMLDERL